MSIKITKQGFGNPMLDNDVAYLSLLTDSILAHADPEAEITLIKVLNEIKVTIKPSVEDFKAHIITNLVAAHRLLSLKVIFSKSLAKQKSISYTITF